MLLRHQVGQVGFPGWSERVPHAGHNFHVPQGVMVMLQPNAQRHEALSAQKLGAKGTIHGSRFTQPLREELDASRKRDRIAREPLAMIGLPQKEESYGRSSPSKSRRGGQETKERMSQDPKRETQSNM